MSYPESKTRINKDVVISFFKLYYKKQNFPLLKLNKN